MSRSSTGSPVPRRRGSAVVAVIIVLVVLQLVVVGMVMTGARDQNLTGRRLETVRAFYAAEAGTNMAVREIMEGVDADGDGTIGTISDDGNSANDPSIAFAAFVVTREINGADTTLASQGRSGSARRRIEALLN